MFELPLLYYMNEKRKISLSGILMVISQLLLAMFLGYWLYGQFVEQRKLLIVDIQNGLKTAEESVIDSLLANNIINPILSDSVFLSGISSDTTGINRPIAIELSIDSIPDARIQVIDREHDGHKKVIRNEFKTDSAEILSDGEVQSSFTIHAFSDTGNQILFQSVKMLISSFGGINDGQKSFVALIASELDTVMLENRFQVFLNDKYQMLEVEWKSLEEKSTGNDMIFHSRLFTDLYGVEISNSTVFLIASITTQLVFAFILLLITGTAFRLSFLNMKNQLKLNKIKSDFISNITHELKTPVSTVKVAIEAILDYNQIKDSTRTREYLIMAQNEIERLDLLVNNVLSNTAIEEGKLFIVPEKQDIVYIINSVLNSMQTQIKNQNANVDFIHEDEELFAFVDKLHIHGAIANLIDNSLKYSNESPQITINLGQGKNAINISVCDNGIGIPKEYLSSIFDKFFRVPMDGKHNVKGYGLGLNYAQLIMIQHGGNITVENNEVSGCCFTLSFPGLK